jgi:hypothetical protein
MSTCHGWADESIVTDICNIDVTDSSNNQAMKRPDSAMWKDSMQCEYDSLIKYETWTLVPGPVNVNVSACKWVFKTKMVKNDASLDTILRIKAVFKRIPEFMELTTRKHLRQLSSFSSVRILLALVAHGCCNRLSQWRSRRDHFHGTTSRICLARTRH